MKRSTLIMILLEENHEAAGPYDAYAVYDTFTDDDDVVIESHTPEKDSVGGGWSVKVGAAAQFKISSNQLLINLSTTTNASQAIVDSGQADCVITGTITLYGNNPQIWFRVDGDDGHAPCYGFTMNPSCSANKLRVFFVTSSWTNKGETAQTYTANDEIEFEITLSGTSISCKDVTNNKTVSFTDSTNQTETEHGVGENYGASGVKMDDFYVQ